MSSHVTDHLVRVAQWKLINAYLVREDDGLTLIDAHQTAGAADALRAAADELGAPIRRILLTHAHPDHVGAVDRLCRQLDGVELIVSKRDAELLRGERRNHPGEGDGKFRGPALSVSATPARLLEDGDMVGSLRAVDAAGHTPGQLAYLDERDGSLICGDAYSTVGGVATTAGPYWRFPLPGFVTWHRPTALESARRLERLAPARLAPGHGSVVENPAAKMGEAIARSAG